MPTAPAPFAEFEAAEVAPPDGAEELEVPPTGAVALPALEVPPTGTVGAPELEGMGGAELAELV